MRKNILCAILAAAMAANLGGCFRKDRDPSPDESSRHTSSESRVEEDSGILPDIGEDISDAVSDIEEEASDLVSDIGGGGITENGDVLNDGLNDSENFHDSSGLTEHDDPEIRPGGVTASLPAETVETAAEALSSEKQGWGQGVQLNEKNQPLSSLSFQDRYQKYDAHFIGPDEPVIYLTFDCGYENGHTAQILDTLKEKDVKAVFFVTLDYVRSEPELVRRMIDEGHTVGNHSDKHPSFPDVDAARREQEIKNVENYLEEHFDYADMDLFRPPAGEFSEQVLAQMQSLGYKTVFWSYAYKDWDPSAQMGPEKAMQKVSGALHDGAIYLLHAVSSDNAAILGDFIDLARSEGYCIELFG